MGVCGKMWLILKDLYIEVQGFVTYGGSTSGLFSIDQGSGQGRIDAPFLYKVFINRLLIIISNDPYSLSLENIPVGCLTFADDLTLLVLFPSFLQHLTSIVFDFSIKWRYEFNHNKSGVVVSGESKIQHAKNMLSRKFNLGLDVVKERKEYKNLGVTKNYAHSCSRDIDEAIKKARRKGGMILSMGFDRKKVNPLIYIKLWKQTCLPSLVFGSELWSLTKTDVACLERCQNWFVRKVFNLPKFSIHLLLLKISGLISLENEIAKRKLFFFARMALSTSDTVLGKLFQARVRSFLSIQNNSFGFIKNVVFLMHKYSLSVSDYFDNWTRNKIFPSYFDWKRIVKSRIAAHENNAWTEYASIHASRYRNS